MPALNEAANIDRVFEDLAAARRQHEHHLDFRVVLVDDGSSDSTGERALEAARERELKLSVLRHDVPEGPGGAFATAFQILPPLDNSDFVLTLEADNTSRLELLDQMLQRSGEGYDAVFASPYAYGGGIVSTNAFRTALSHVANSFVKEFLGIRGLLTVSSFYRLYRGAAIRRLQDHYGPAILERPGFESMVELALKMTYLKMSISEVPMVLDAGRRVGKSKMRVTQTGLGYFALFKQKGAWKRAARAARGG
jgi:glycosyltransferase involved in cell wall biosynthesis